MSNTKSTELDFTEKDHPEFTVYFWKNFLIAVGIGFSATIGLIVGVVNADVIDNFFSEILKAIFL